MRRRGQGNDHTETTARQAERLFCPKCTASDACNDLPVCRSNADFSALNDFSQENGLNGSNRARIAFRREASSASGCSRNDFIDEALQKSFAF